MVIATEGSWDFSRVFSLKAKTGKMAAVLLAPCYDQVAFDSLKYKRKSAEVWRAPHAVLTTSLHSTPSIFWKVLSEKLV